MQQNDSLADGFNGTCPPVVALTQLQPHASSPNAPGPKLPFRHGGRALSTALREGGTSSELWPAAPPNIAA